MADDIWLFVGLGNPGTEYRNNRHNIGFMAIDEIVDRHNFDQFKSKYKGEFATGKIDGQKIIALKPMTFMNLSGASVAQFVNFYKIPLDKVIVFHDELDVDPARIKIKKGGGAGGHNGLRSIDGLIGKDYWRVRLGIGHPGHKERVNGYVLGNFSKQDEIWLEKLIAEIPNEIEHLFTDNKNKFVSNLSLKL